MWRAKGFCENCWSIIFIDGKDKEEIEKVISKMNCCNKPSYELSWEEVKDKKEDKKGSNK